MKPVVYDAGMLVAADRGQRQLWAEHRVRLEAGSLPLVPAVVVAQVSRSPRQAQLGQLLRGCEVVAFEEEDGHRVGALLARARTKDVVDAAVVALAVERKADIQTPDAADLRRLTAAARANVTLLEL